MFEGMLIFALGAAAIINLPPMLLEWDERRTQMMVTVQTQDDIDREKQQVLVKTKENTQK